MSPCTWASFFWLRINEECGIAGLCLLYILTHFWLVLYWGVDVCVCVCVCLYAQVLFLADRKLLEDRQWHSIIH